MADSKFAEYGPKNAVVGSWEELEKLSPAARFYDVRNQLKRHIYRRVEDACRQGEIDRDAEQMWPGTLASGLDHEDLLPSFRSTWGGRIPSSE